MYRFETDSENCTKEELATTERTKIWIAETAKKLLETKSIEKISVAEICQAADIGRQTFYYHFADKHELMAWIFLHLVSDTDLLDVESSAHYLKLLRQNRTFFKRAYEDTSQAPIWQYALEYYIKKYTDLAKERLGVDTLDTQLEYSIRFYCYGCIGVTREWLLSDGATPAQTAMQMAFNSMPGSMRKVFFADEAEV